MLACVFCKKCRCFCIFYIVINLIPCVFCIFKVKFPHELLLCNSITLVLNNLQWAFRESTMVQEQWGFASSFQVKNQKTVLFCAWPELGAMPHEG